MSDLSPVLLTGASGFLAKHVGRALLEAGHAVRGSLRDAGRAEGLRRTLLEGLPREADERLYFVSLDLTRDEGWDEALAGTSALMHTASPFPLDQPRDPLDLIRPALGGTRRALGAAARAGVRRVVLTSSTEAIENHKPYVLTEEDWADPDRPGIRAYTRSKILAERAAWDLARAEGLALTTVNPGLILGPLLDDRTGTSTGLVQRLLKGRDPALPDLGFGAVDARDVAQVHARALSTPTTEGERLLAVGGSTSFPEMARRLKAASPDRRIPTMTAPKPLLRVMALFIPELRQMLPQVGRHPRFSSDKASRLLGLDFIPPEQALLATARSLLERGLV